MKQTDAKELSHEKEEHACIAPPILNDLGVAGCNRITARMGGWWMRCATSQIQGIRESISREIPTPVPLHHS
jgi:hypothetical protein